MPTRPFMHHLPQLARWVLLWFALSLGAAIASPMVSPKTVELICSSAGAMKLIVKSDDGSISQGSHTLDCALCVGTAAPPPAQICPQTQPSGLSYATQAIPQARVATLLFTQPPPRGPPL